MITAGYDELGSLVFDAALIGTCNRVSKKVIIDTGFSGDIALPVSVACAIGLTPAGAGRIALADGTIITVPLFMGKIEVGGEVRDAIYMVVEGTEEVLVGMGFLERYKICFYSGKKEIEMSVPSSASARPSAIKEIEELQSVLKRLIPRHEPSEVVST